jgi:dTDP-glucose 4,6-dehydratase
MMKRIIITGGAGFIGSHLVLRWIKECPDATVVNVDKLSYASNVAFLDPVQECPNYHLETVDICERQKVRELVRSFEPDGVIHLAAESHVDNSILDPEPFVLTNIVGTFNLLEECRQYWQKVRLLEKARFHHVSTDEVYGALRERGLFTEFMPHQPNSPYSASKASSDHLVRAYYQTFGMNTVITNCSNNFGPNQHDEKLIPTVIRSALHHNPIPVYGRGENIRDWIFVADHCRAIELVFEKGRAGETYNVGGRNEWKNVDLIRRICCILNDFVGRGPGGDYRNLMQFVTDRPGHDFRYAIDPSKIENELCWAPMYPFEDALKHTVTWYLEKYR